jgi:transcriptional regulator with XRE-family HTH domain
MVKLKRHELAAEASRRNRAHLGALGASVRAARHRRRLTQAQLGARVGIARATVSAIERGFGGGHTLDTWQRLALALELPLRVELARDALIEPTDAGHLLMQELVLRLGRAAGYLGQFELPTRPLDPVRSADVCLLDRVRRRLLINECWNTFGDIGASARSTNRKVAEAHALVASLFGDVPAYVGCCWIVRDTRRNRELVGRYPEVFRARFPGSSDAWVRALTTGSLPPAEPGLVWCDVRATRLIPWRPRRSEA